MPFIKDVYVELNGQVKYELEANYYLRFYVRSALKAIERIRTADLLQYYDGEFPLYYHSHLMTLFSMLGLINDRMIAKKRTTSAHKDIIKLTRSDYQFSKEKYKALSNKDTRNFMHHIQERNLSLLETSSQFTPFNSISNQSDKDMLKSLKNDKYNSFLDVDALKYHYYDYNKDKRVTIDIIKLEKELNMLKERVYYIHSVFIKNGFIAS